MEEMSQADEIREYVLVALIKPARRLSRDQVTMRASEIAQSIGLANRFPNICQVLDSGTFEGYAGVHLLKRLGPPHGSSVTWTFRVLRDD